jgi:16S rRNA processing protein RimM
VAEGSDGLVAIARIVKARGLRGEVVAEILTDFPERFDGLEHVTALLLESGVRQLAIEEHWFQKDRVILKFAGVNDVDTAETLRNAEICIPEDEAVELEDDEFYDWQLAGCDVRTTEGTAIGTVREIMRTGGTEILVVDGDKEYLVPFAESICIEVDVENRTITIDPPEGLLEF